MHPIFRLMHKPGTKSSNFPHSPLGFKYRFLRCAVRFSPRAPCSMFSLPANIMSSPFSFMSSPYDTIFNFSTCPLDVTSYASRDVEFVFDDAPDVSEKNESEPEDEKREK